MAADIYIYSFFDLYKKTDLKSVYNGTGRTLKHG